ncbi:MAG: hypothetical protein LUE99_15215 [Bacteroides sp.]|nr:hypothetical protein [Bacteroides sp.]
MDGAICTEMRQFSRCLAEPKSHAVKTINELYDAGNTIIIYSARTWVEYEMTVDWLKRHGIRYHQLFMGKPIGDVWIDDRAITANENWEEIGEQLKNREK